MRIVLRVAMACSTTLLLAACAKSDQAKTDSAAGTAAAPAPAAAAPAAPAPAPALALADVAGKWQMRSTPESGKDTTTITYVLSATADTTGWTLNFPSGLKVPLHVTASGDSLIESAGPYASQRRKGKKVTTQTTLRLQNGKLVGTTVAHFNTGPDSVVRAHVEGTKTP